MREQIEALDRIVVEHRKYSDVKDEVLGHVQASPYGEIIMCIAPTGAGKTTMITDIIGDYRHMKSNGCIVDNPPISVEAPVPLDRGYPWKTHYIQLLEALGEIGTDRRIAAKSHSPGKGNAPNPPALNGARLDDLRRATDSALYDRNPAAVFVDEAQHMGASPQGRVAANNLDAIKQHKNAVDIPWVMFGTYQAQQMLGTTGQMARRVRLLYLAPYYPCSPERAEFSKIMARVIEQIGTPLTFTIKAHEDELYSRSLGCVGLFCSWLGRSMARAEYGERKRVTWRDMEATGHYGWELDTIQAEIEAFDRFAEGQGRAAGSSEGPGKGRRGRFVQASPTANKPGTPAPYRWPTGTSKR